MLLLLPVLLSLVLSLAMGVEAPGHTPPEEMPVVTVGLQVGGEQAVSMVAQRRCL